MGPLARLPLHPLLLAAYAVLFVYAANISEVLPADLLWPLAVALAGAAVRAGCLRRCSTATCAGEHCWPAPSCWPSPSSATSARSWTKRSSVSPCSSWPGPAFIVAVGRLRRERERSSPAGHRPRSTSSAWSCWRSRWSPSCPPRRAAPRAPRRVSPSAATSSPKRPDCPSATSTSWSSIATAPTGPSTSASASRTTSTRELDAAGFSVIPGARANYRATDFSLASMLSMDMLDDLTESVGRESGDRTPARAQAGRPRSRAVPARQRLSLLPPRCLVRADAQQPHRRRGARLGQDHRVRTDPARCHHPAGRWSG